MKKRVGGQSIGILWTFAYLIDRAGRNVVISSGFAQS